MRIYLYDYASATTKSSSIFRPEDMLTINGGLGHEFLRAIPNLTSPAILFAHVESLMIKQAVPLEKWFDQDPCNYLVWMSEGSPGTKGHPFQEYNNRVFRLRIRVSQLKEVEAGIERIRALTSRDLGEISRIVRTALSGNGMEVMESLAKSPSEADRLPASVTVAPSANDSEPSDVELAFDALVQLVLATPDESGTWIMPSDLATRLARLAGSAILGAPDMGQPLTRPLTQALANLLRQWLKRRLSTDGRSPGLRALHIALRPEACVAIGAIGHAWLDNTVCCYDIESLRELLSIDDQRRWFIGVAKEYLLKCEWLEENYATQASPASLVEQLSYASTFSPSDREALHQEFLARHRIEPRIDAVRAARVQLSTQLEAVASSIAADMPDTDAIREFLQSAAVLRASLNDLPRTVPLP